MAEKAALSSGSKGNAAMIASRLALSAMAGSAVAGLAAALTLAAPSFAQTTTRALAPGPAPSEFTQIPSGADFARLYPRQALAQRVSGQLRMRCLIAAQGRLNGCVILEEAPLNMGFGQATLRLAERFQVRETTADGRATAGGRITIPVEWRVVAPAVTPAKQ